MIKKLKKTTLGVLMALAIITPFTTYIAVEAAPLSEASAVNSPLYSVTVPKEIQLGELKETNYQSIYNLDVELLQPDLGDVYIESPQNFALSNGGDTIQVNSTLRNNGVLSSKEVKALFWVDPTTVLTLAQGNYAGTIDFVFNFRADEELDATKGNNISGRDVGMITNGFADVVQNNSSDVVHNFSVDRVSEIKDVYSEKITLSMVSVSGMNEQIIQKLDKVVEVRIPMEPLFPIDNTEYKVENATTGKVLAKLESRPEVGNYTDGQYFATVDGVYIYTNNMSSLNIYEGTIEDGSYPPEFEPSPEVGGGSGSDFTPDIDNSTNNNTGDTNGSTSTDTVTPNVNSGDGSYTADVSMRKANDFTSLSMCDSLFYSKADITFAGDNATVSLYVIDPIPAFPTTGTPLTNVKYMYKSSNYNASINSSNKVAKYFPTAAGFIDTAGNYYTSKIVATFPKQAIADSISGGLMMEAYVNAVMESTQEFYIVFSNLSGGSTPTVTDTSNIIDVDESGTVDGASDNGDGELSTNGNGGSNGLGNNLADILTNGLLGAGFEGGAIATIFGSIMTGLSGFYAYAYYLHRKKESGDV